MLIFQETWILKRIYSKDLTSGTSDEVNNSCDQLYIILTEELKKRIVNTEGQ